MFIPPLSLAKASLFLMFSWIYNENGLILLNMFLRLFQEKSLIAKKRKFLNLFLVINIPNSSVNDPSPKFSITHNIKALSGLCPNMDLEIIIILFQLTKHHRPGV